MIWTICYGTLLCKLVNSGVWPSSVSKQCAKVSSKSKMSVLVCQGCFGAGNSTKLSLLIALSVNSLGS